MLYAVSAVLMFVFSDLLAMAGVGAAFLFVPLFYYMGKTPSYMFFEVTSTKQEDVQGFFAGSPCPGAGERKQNVTVMGNCPNGMPWP
jgi:hypothetical protein